MKADGFDATPANANLLAAAGERGTVSRDVVAALNDPRCGAGVEFWIEVKRKHPRTFATIASRLIPVEVQGQMDHTLTVTVQKIAMTAAYSPLQGTCAPLGNAANTPIALPIDGETVPKSEDEQ